VVKGKWKNIWGILTCPFLSLHVTHKLISLHKI
jgi:hypothetical protein